MSFRFLDTYDELNGNMGFPKMKDSLCDTPYPTKVAVIMHLKSGNVHMVTASKFVDVFTG